MASLSAWSPAAPKTKTLMFLVGFFSFSFFKAAWRYLQPLYGLVILLAPNATTYWFASIFRMVLAMRLSKGLNTVLSMGLGILKMGLFLVNSDFLAKFCSQVLGETK